MIPWWGAGVLLGGVAGSTTMSGLAWGGVVIFWFSGMGSRATGLLTESLILWARVLTDSISRWRHSSFWTISLSLACLIFWVGPSINVSGHDCVLVPDCWSFGGSRSCGGGGRRRPKTRSMSLGRPCLWRISSHFCAHEYKLKISISAHSIN